MAVAQHDGRRGIGALIRDLAEGSATLVRQEIRLVRLELTAILRGAGAGTGFVALGAVLALLGSLAFFTGVILLVGDQWLRDQYWLGALAVTVIAGGVAAWFTKRGFALLSPKQLAPDQTVATLKEDKEWLKRQLKSGATSN
jgi:hypothetical protein